MSLQFPCNYAVMVARKPRSELTEKYSPKQLWRIIYLATQYPLPNYIKVKDVFKEALLAFNLGGDLEMLNIMHRYAVRLGLKERAPIIERLVAVVLVGVLAEGILDTGVIDSVSTEDARGFTFLNSKLGTARQVIASVNERRRELADRYGLYEDGPDADITWTPKMIQEFIDYSMEILEVEFELPV